jgi:GDP-mannose 4,6-dehydratase
MTTKVFITGISGMVGSHLADFLLENTDWQVHGFLPWQADLSNLSHLSQQINTGKRLELHYGDLNDQVSLLKVLESVRPDYVYHLGAQSFPKTSFDAPIETYTTNILGTARLLESLRHLKLDPWIHVCSSSEVFGRVPKEKTPIDESCDFHPSSPYAISKVGTDLIAQFHAQAYGQKIITTRMFTHTGPRRGDVFAESSFAKQIALIEAKEIPPVVKVGNLDSLRTYADVRDAVRAYYLLLTENPQAGEVYNIGGDHVCTVGEMLKTLLSLSTHKGIKIEVDKERLRPLDADVQIPNADKFKTHTGWQAEISFATTMEDLLNYWRQRVAQGSGVVR